MPHFRPFGGTGLPLESLQMGSLLRQRLPASKGVNTMGMDVMLGWTNSAYHAQLDMAERSGAAGGVDMTVTSGLVVGTRVASNMGWRPVEALAPGDMVLTFDNGMQRVVAVERTTFAVNAYGDPSRTLPVIVPAGALGNSEEIKLLPEQGVLVESDAAMDAYGDPFAIISASALNGFRDVRRAMHTQQVDVVKIIFDAPQVVYVNGGLLAHCPQPRLGLTDMLDVDGVAYDVVEGRDAAFLVECMQYEDYTAEAARYAA